MRVKKQYLYALIAAFIWGTAFAAQDVCTDRIGPFAFNALRATVGALALGIFQLVRTQAARRLGTPAPKIGNLRDLLVGGIFSGVLLFFAANLQQSGIADSGGGKAAFITALYIVLVPVFALFIGEKTALSAWIAVPIAAVGLYFLSVKEGLAIATGDLLLIACAVAFALQILVVDRYVECVDGVALSAVQFVVMGALSWIGVAFEDFDLSMVGACLLPILYVGIFSCGVAYTLQILSQKDTNPTVVSLIFSLESVFGMIATAAVVRTFPTPREQIGCVILLAAVLLVQLPSPKRKEKKLP